ncbi:MAG: FHA domain-containing protein [Anaerolineaceae bacterium]|nr:FHA domain-containing protein [Anaerolineaceae bacterium]
MSDDRTARMDQPNWSRKETDPDEQKTVMADQENVTPPTLPMGDQGRRGWGESTGPGFVRSEPSHPITPPGQPPFGSQGPEGQTMIIKERPTPVFAWLVVVDGPDRNSIGTVHTLHPDPTSLGRVSGNHIVLNDETVSAQHARIRREVKEGQEPVFALFDMGSRNGIYAGPKDSYKDEENRVYRHELQDGDYLLMGETTLVFKKL